MQKVIGPCEAINPRTCRFHKDQFIQSIERPGSADTTDRDAFEVLLMQSAQDDYEAAGLTFEDFYTE